MTEATVANVALVIRVLLVGGILIALPRITRRGLMFGVYVGEQFAGGDTARGLLRSWDRGCLLVMATALVVGLTISVLGHPVTGNLTGTGVLLLLASVLYLRTYSLIRASAPAGLTRQARRVTVSLQEAGTGPERAAKATLVICLLAAIATLAYAMTSYRSMPEQVPSLTQALGGRVGSADRSILAVMYTPSVNLVMSPFFALLAWMMATAKRSLREGDNASLEAQASFRSAMSYLTSGTAIFVCALLGLLSVQLVRVWRLDIATVGTGIWWLSGAMVVFMGGGMVRIMKLYGQGGARIERSGMGALTGGLADNAHWVLGMFYVDRDDPSMMVEKRFGLGYTINYGNRHALSIMIAFVALLLALIALAFLL